MLVAAAVVVVVLVAVAIGAAGGWVTIPLALVFGALVGFGLRVARLVESDGVARISCSWMRWVAVTGRAWRETMARGARLGVLAAHLAGRGPPVAVA